MCLRYPFLGVEFLQAGPLGVALWPWRMLTSGARELGLLGFGVGIDVKKRRPPGLPIWPGGLEADLNTVQ